MALAKEANEERDRSKAASDRMRERADSWGKSLITVGTAAVGVIGITKATDAFPVPEGWTWLTLLTIGLLIVMAVAAISLGWRVTRVGKPLVMKSSPADISDLTREERDVVSKLYQAYAVINDRATLQEYDDYGHDIAAKWENDKTGDPEPTQPFNRAVQVRAEVRAAQQRAAALVVQKRLAKATTGFVTLMSVGIFLTAAVGVSMSAQKLHSLRLDVTDKLVTIRQCGEAQKALDDHPVITLQLPKECIAK
ncbi:MAG TPA: hypothetical protein VGJ20_39640 [Xanthobacteraceae bacterium]